MGVHPCLLQWHPPSLALGDSITPPNLCRPPPPALAAHHHQPLLPTTTNLAAHHHQPFCPPPASPSCPPPPTTSPSFPTPEQAPTCWSSCCSATSTQPPALGSPRTSPGTNISCRQALPLPACACEEHQPPVTPGMESCKARKARDGALQGLQGHQLVALAH